jgi:putative transposase
MDGRGRFLDDIFIERLWRSLKYEDIFIKAHETVAAVRAGIDGWLTLYNDERPHQALGHLTPRAVYEARGPWVCGQRSRCAALHFGVAHIPTGTSTKRKY